MDDSYILNDIPISLNAEKLLQQLRIQPQSRFEKEFLFLKDQALNIAKPKAMYRKALIKSKLDSAVSAENITLTSRVLRVNLENTNCIYAFLSTCGNEIEAWSQNIKDMLHRFWIDSIKQAVLFSAGKTLRDHIISSHHLGKTAEMSPGEFEDWPISEQEKLFSLLGDTQNAIGVSLSSGFMMSPVKSRSGILFTTEEDFESCMLCSQPKCRGRRAPFDKNLYDQKYRL